MRIKLKQTKTLPKWNKTFAFIPVITVKNELIWLRPVWKHHIIDENIGTVFKEYLPININPNKYEKAQLKKQQYY